MFVFASESPVQDSDDSGADRFGRSHFDEIELDRSLVRTPNVPAAKKARNVTAMLGERMYTRAEVNAAVENAVFAVRRELELKFESRLKELLQGTCCRLGFCWCWSRSQTDFRCWCRTIRSIHQVRGRNCSKAE